MKSINIGTAPSRPDVAVRVPQTVVVNIMVLFKEKRVTRLPRGTLFAETVLGGGALPPNAPVSAANRCNSTLAAARLGFAAYCASIQVLDPTSLTATFEKERCSGSPLRVPR